MKERALPEGFELTLSVMELKLLYRALWAQMKNDPRLLAEDDDATDLFFALQNLLQREAGRTGVDVGDHSQWAAWVGIGDTCSLRPR
jgi:hypothetical protein